MTVRSAAGAERQAVVAIKELLSRVKRSDSVTVMLFGNCGVKLSPSIRDPSRRVRFLAVISIFPKEPVVLSTALKTVPPWLNQNIAVRRVQGNVARVAGTQSTIRAL